MALRTFKPTTPGQRQLVLVDRSALYKGEPVKALTTGKMARMGASLSAEEKANVAMYLTKKPLA